MGCTMAVEGSKGDEAVSEYGEYKDGAVSKQNYGKGYKLELIVVLRQFEDIIKDRKIRNMVVNSLLKAKAQAKVFMSKKLFGYFDRMFPGCGWPTTIPEYMQYVWLYMTQIPFATTRMNFIDERVSESSQKYAYLQLHQEEYTKCVYNEICHFYWLVNQKMDDGCTLQSIDVFASWLKTFGLASGIFLNSRGSLTPKSLETFEKDERYHLDWYNDNKDNWVSFNTFFCREFNGAHPITGISPLRPIDPNKFVMTAPADCTFKQIIKIDEKGVFREMNDSTITFKMKGFSEVSTVHELLGFEAAPYWKSFYGGTFIHCFLSPFDYHRFHTPVAGVVTAVEIINGQNYLAVGIKKDGQFEAPDTADNGYEFQQQRGLIIVDNEEFGLVATLPVGMCQVSGVIMYKNQLLYRQVPKGQEFGRFVFGGSDIILVTEKSLDQLDIVTGSETNPHVFQYGSPAVRIVPVG